jgi:hypothetical protein
MSIPIDRRDALALLASTTAAAGWSGSAFARGRARPTRVPMLASPEQLEAEQQLLALIHDPQVMALQAKIGNELLSTTIGQSRDGAATVGRAVSLWTNSLIFAELGTYRSRPDFLWGTDDTPRSWYGHEFGVGTSGDNPDAIYRTAQLDGTHSYVMEGRFDPQRPAAQLVIEVAAADQASPETMMEMQGGQLVMQNVTLKILIGDRMDVSPDGSFRVTLSPEDGGGNHVKLKPGRIVLGTRDILSDWTQRPARLQIREVGAAPAPAKPTLSFDALRDEVLKDLPGFIKFWSNFPNVWFGGLKPNTHSAPMGRNGGWGFVAGLRYALQPGQAMVVTTVKGPARYTGFQINDPWMIQPDARRHQVCLNNTQTVWSADGSATYVISAEDPGVANWLDPGGVTSGLGIMRWQAVPKEMTNEGLIREVKVVSLADVAGMGLPMVSPAQRRQTIARRALDYASRTR